MTAKRRSGGGGGSVRASASVSGSFLSHLFSNFHLFQINIGGRGRRGGGLVGRIKRVARSGLRTMQEARGKDDGKPSRGRSGGRPARSFAEFQQERPDLFDGPPEFDISVDSDQDEDEDEA